MTSDESVASEPAAATPTARSRWGWWLFGAAIVIEFWLFGSRGEIEVCVGKAEVHDFDLVGQPRDDANRWRVPRCESRLNLGLQSEYDAQVTEATKAACRGATLFRHHGEAQACAAEAEGWQHQVSTTFVLPWDARSRERLFWFLYD